MTLAGARARDKILKGTSTARKEEIANDGETEGRNTSVREEERYCVLKRETNGMIKQTVFIPVDLSPG